MTGMAAPKRLAGALAGALLIAASATGAQPASADMSPVAMPPARPIVPFVKHAEVDCDWTMKDAGEEWIRGSIGRGDEDPVISLVDTAFYSWSDSEEHAIELSAGDPARRVPASAWAGNAGGQMPGSIGFYLDPPLRQLIGGATSVQVWKNGEPVFNAAWAGTPSVAELEACVRPPSDDHGDSE